MAPLSFFLVLLAVSLLLITATLLKVFALKKENALLAEQLTETSVSLEKTRHSLEKLQQRQEERIAFRNDLDEAEESSRQHQQKTKEFQAVERKWAAPERYGFIHTLAAKGMSVEEIAAILTVSPHEARQVLNLAKIGQGNEADGDKGKSLRFSPDNR